MWGLVVIRLSENPSQTDALACLLLANPICEGIHTRFTCFCSATFRDQQSWISCSSWHCKVPLRQPDSWRSVLLLGLLEGVIEIYHFPVGILSVHSRIGQSRIGILWAVGVPALYSFWSSHWPITIPTFSGWDFQLKLLFKPKSAVRWDNLCPQEYLDAWRSQYLYVLNAGGVTPCGDAFHPL